MGRLVAAVAARAPRFLPSSMELAQRLQILIMNADAISPLSAVRLAPRANCSVYYYSRD